MAVCVRSRAPACGCVSSLTLTNGRSSVLSALGFVFVAFKESVALLLTKSRLTRYHVGIKCLMLVDVEDCLLLVLIKYLGVSEQCV